MANRKPPQTALAKLVAAHRPQHWQPRPELLLHPNIPKPMHGLAPRVVLGQPWWERTRQAAFASTDYCCAACAVPKADALYHAWLEGHELYDIDYRAGRMVYVETVGLCHACHNYIHSGRMQALVSQGKMSAQKCLDILQHGQRVLRRPGMVDTRVPNSVRPTPPVPTDVADWGDWRMVVDGVEYKPLFASQQEWEAHYGH